MSTNGLRRVHVITGGFPPGELAGHDMDYTRLRLLQMADELGLPATVANDFTEVQKWLPLSKLMITYLAGPFLNDEQNEFVRKWLADGGRWLALHGSSGGKAKRVEGSENRQMVKTSHHDTLGGFFISHPPMLKFRVAVSDGDDMLTRDLPASFEITDEPYMVEIQHPSDTRVLLTSELGPDDSGYGFYYEKDTSLQPDGKTRVLGYTRDMGKGGVTYIALGHCHSPASNSQTTVDDNVDAEGAVPLKFRGPWETDAYVQLLRNAIEWGVN